MIELLIHRVAVVTLALTLGGMVFFAAITAPTVFATLDGASGARFLRRIFPRYYLYMALTSGIAGATVAKEDIFGGLAILGVCSLFVWARQLLMPAINRARDAEQEGDASQGERFKRLHRASVIINMIQLVIVFGVFLTTAIELGAGAS